MDEPCGSHVTFLVCLLLFFHRERSRAPRGRVGAGGPRGAQPSPTSFENSGAVLSQLVRECPHPVWQFLFQPLTLCSCCFADLVPFSPPPPIVPSHPVKWCHGQLKSIQGSLQNWMTSIYFIPWALAAGRLWKPHPAGLGRQPQD